MGDKILDLIYYVFFQTDMLGVYGVISHLLYFVGLFLIFRKSGLKGWWAFVPCAREYKLGQAADMEDEGRLVAVLFGVDYLIETLFTFIDFSVLQTLQTILAFVQLMLALTVFIYTIRIYLGLITVYDKKKRWAWLWVFFNWLAALIWGIDKRIQPLWTVSDMEGTAANFFSGAKATVLDRGLTVNLEERTAIDFFKKKYLLRDIHMYVSPGRMVLLLGGSGAGKTTFLNAVNGYEKAKAEVVLNGSNLYKNYKQMQFDIGFVPQQDLMRGSDSVYRTLIDAAILRLPKGFSRADRLKRVDEVMDMFGLTPVKNSLVVKLSGGQRKRLSIAMEFISNPSLFILDEPDSGLDGVMARELFNQLRVIADQGKIIIVITHTPDRVVDLFDDVIVLAKDSNRTGRLAYFGPIDEAQAFFGKDRMEDILMSINRPEEGGEGRADEFIVKYAEVQHV